MKFAHLADTHLGYRQYNLDEREEDFYSAFEEAVDAIIGEKVELVVHSGDLFDEPRPHIKSLVRVREALERLQGEGIPFISIAGNHDLLMRRGAVPPQRIFSSLRLLTPKSPFYEYGDTLIAGLPYFSKMHGHAMKELLERISEKAEGYSSSLLLLHQAIDKYFSLEYELSLSDLPKGFDYYALGHVHKRVVDELPSGGKLVYPGSTELWRTDELVEYQKHGKGFFISNTETFELKKVDLSIRPFLSFSVSSREDIEKIAEEIDGMEKRPVVRVEVKAEEFHRVYRQALAELGGRALHIDFRREVEVREEEEPPREKIDLHSLISESFDGSEDEKAFCLRLYETASRGGAEAGISEAEKFFKLWGGKDDN